MSEQRLQDLFACLAAFRSGLVDISGRVAMHAGRVRDAGLDGDADDLDACARELAAGLETMTRIADGAQDETIPMSMSEIAD